MYENKWYEIANYHAPPCKRLLIQAIEIINERKMGGSIVKTRQDVTINLFKNVKPGFAIFYLQLQFCKKAKPAIKAGFN